MRREETEAASPSDEKTYAVGYDRPPRAHCFQAGQSGNPRGRPKGQLNFDTLLEAALRQKVTIKEQGTPRTMPKIQVIVTQLVNRAAGGDPRATKLLFDLKQRLEAKRAVAPPPAEAPPAQKAFTIDEKAWARAMKNMSLEEMVQLLDSMLMIEAKMDDRPRFPLPPGSPPRKLENAEDLGAIGQLIGRPAGEGSH
jgi:hypothetical protein